MICFCSDSVFLFNLLFVEIRLMFDCVSLWKVFVELVNKVRLFWFFRSFSNFIIVLLELVVIVVLFLINGSVLWVIICFFL